MAIKLGIAQAPSGATRRQFHAVAVLCGIGFTMSLFIGSLAFEDDLLLREMKIGVLLGSLLSAVVGLSAGSSCSSHRRVSVAAMPKSHTPRHVLTPMRQPLAAPTTI